MKMFTVRSKFITVWLECGKPRLKTNPSVVKPKIVTSMGTDLLTFVHQMGTKDDLNRLQISCARGR